MSSPKSKAKKPTAPKATTTPAPAQLWMEVMQSVAGLRDQVTAAERDGVFCRCTARSILADLEQVECEVMMALPRKTSK